METKLCPNCNSALPERAFFCPNCLSQVKCKNCNELLEKDSKGCIICGTPIAKDSNIDGKAINRIEYEQKGDSRKLSANFTNEVGGQLSHVLNNMIGGGYFPPRKNNTTISKQIDLNGDTSTNDADDADVLETTALNSTGPNTLGKIFKLEGDKLELVDNRLKHTSQRGFYTRLVILFLYANQKLLGKNVVPRNEVTVILERNNANDANARFWLAHSKELIRKESGDIGLNVVGNEMAESFLAEITNPSIEQKSVVQNGTKRQKKKQSSTEGETNTIESPKSKSTKNGNGAYATLRQLISEGYFNQRRTTGEIGKYCKEKKGKNIPSKEISSRILVILKRDKLIERERNSEGLYEYYVSK